MRIQHNIAALNSYRQLGTNNTATSKNLEKLSSGYKINRAGDDAAGLAISEKMRAQITGLEKAQDNANDGISLVQTAEGALTEVHSMLNRMTELAEQSANGTYDDDTDRANLQKEVNSLKDEIDRIADGTNFNGIELLDGSMTAAVAADSGVKFEINGGANLVAGKSSFGVAVGTDGTVAAPVADNMKYDKAGTATAVTKAAYTITADENNPTGTDKGVYKYTVTVDKSTATAEEYEQWNGVTISMDTRGFDGTEIEADTDQAITNNGTLKLQIGDTSQDFNQLNVEIASMKSADLGIGDIDISTQSGAATAMDAIKAAINKVSSTRGDIGAIQNRLEHTINNLGVTTENVTAAESRIRDVDMAKEMMNYTKNNILIQASQSMLAQANQMPQGVLQLLQ